jgi:heme exporter protein B
VSASEAGTSVAGRAHPNGFAQTWAIVRKDVIMELRTKEMITAMFLFVMVTMVIFYVAFFQRGPAAEAGALPDLTGVSGGLLWTAFAFMSLLGLNRSFVHEKDEGCLDGLLLAPLDRPVIFFGKMIGNLIFIGVVELLTIPIFSMFFIQASWLPRAGWLLAVLVLADLGVCTLGTLFSTISINTKARDLMLPVLLLPVLIPLMIFAVQATTTVITGLGMAQLDQWLYSLAGYDALFMLASFALYDFVIGD